MEFLTKRFKKSKDKEAIIWEGKSYKYKWLLEEINRWKSKLMESRIEPGCVVILEADFSPRSIALFLALAEHKSIVVPMMSFTESAQNRLIEIAQAEVSISIGNEDREHISMLPYTGKHDLYERLRKLESPGLILFSSGSTGEPKASLHDLNRLMFKFEAKRHRFRTIAFLLFDHIGGINTMFYTLSNTGCMIAVGDRTPDKVLELIEKHRAELLPTSPTFLNLLLLCDSLEKYDLSSLQLVTYGTEPMPASTLKHLNDLLPHVRFLQTYGLSEMGILRSKSKSSGSLWVKVGGEGFQTRIVNGILQIKSPSAMLGYLNAESPFTEDGWFITGDEVETDGEYIKILGRRSDLINVGGQKVFPAEIESVIRTIENVAEVLVYGKPFPIVNNIVCADVRLKIEQDHKEFISKVKKHCLERLESYKVPMNVNIVGDKQHNVRFKKVRKSQMTILKSKPKIAFVFAGQGPRWPHTQRELLGKEPVFQSVLDECDELLRQHADWSFLQEMKRKEPGTL
jgi:acyl-coenzyme A synthetase/AMP-(fatty) acid ligase